MANVTVPQATAYSQHRGPYNATHPAAWVSVSPPDPSAGRKPSANCRLLSRLATHFSIFYRAFSHNCHSFSCQENRHKNRNKRHHSRKSSTTPHNSPQTPIETAISGQNPSKLGNRPQLPTNAHETQRKRQDSRKKISPLGTFLINKIVPQRPPERGRAKGGRAAVLRTESPDLYLF